MQAPVVDSATAKGSDVGPESVPRAPGDAASQDSGEWKLQGPSEILLELQGEYSEKDRFEAQGELDDAVKTLHDSSMERWKSELDTLLVYAGLFSAVLTAFNVESYRLLQPDDADAAVSAVKELSAHLRELALNDRAGAAARVMRTPQDDVALEFRPPAFVVWVNCLWFSSLILSLASASIGLLAKQWLYESNSGISGQSRASTQLLQYRMDNLKKWKVRDITMLVPVLLQLALIIFLIGLVILLWNLHTIVAAVSSTFTGLLFVFLVVVTGLPSYRWDCCYRAPQALLVYTIVRTTRNKIADILQWCVKICSAHTSSRFFFVRLWWSTLQQCCGMLSRAPKYPTWQAQERLDLRKQSGALNIETAITAYYTTLDPLCLDRMRISLSGETDAPLVRCLRALDVGIGNGTIAPAALLKQNVRGRLSSMVLTALRQMLTVDSKSRDDLWEPTVQRLFSMCTVMVPGEQLPHNGLLLKTAFYIAMQTTSTENLYTALNYLATAVNVDSPMPCDYLTVSHVLSAAEQWIEKQQLSGEAQQSASIAPQNNIVAFNIVVHCMLCVMTKKTAIPDPQRDHFESLCARACGALSSLPNFLPPGEALLNGMPQGNEDLCNALSFGLQLLLGPLTRLSQSIDASNLVHETPLIHEDVIDKLEYVWGTAEAVLRPTSRSPGPPPSPLPQNMSPRTRLGITSRLRALQDDVNSLFPQVFGPVLVTA